MLVSGIGGSGLTTCLVVSYRSGKRDGEQTAELTTLRGQHAEQKRNGEKKEAWQARQNLRIFAAIEQLRRLHKTGNGGGGLGKVKAGGGKNRKNEKSHTMKKQVCPLLIPL